MKRFGCLAILTMLFVAGCKKNYPTSAGIFYGTWVKGSAFGDTLLFTTRNGKNVMRICESFNAGLPVYTEKGYKFENGRLYIQSFAPASTDFYDIDSFTWTQPGSEFKLQGAQLFIFMSSTNTYFTYHKIN